MKKEDFIRKIHLLRKSSIIFLLLILLLSCNNNEKRDYGYEFNDDRELIGLKVLPKNWIKHPKTDSGRIWWTSPTAQTQISDAPRFSEKVLLLIGDTLVSETDVYTNYEKYETVYGTFQVSLLYTYYFYDYEEFKRGWTYFFRNESSRNKLSGYITREEADSVLKSWNIN